jgi:hypothetical protein
MRALALMTFSALALAACDTPDPSEFHHALRSDAMTGTHLNGAVGSGEVTSSTDTHGIEQMERNGINQLGGK